MIAHYVTLDFNTPFKAALLYHYLMTTINDNVTSGKLFSILNCHVRCRAIMQVVKIFSHLSGGKESDFTYLKTGGESDFRDL